MYHIEMAAHMYNIWSLAYRTHSDLYGIVLICYAFYLAVKTVLTYFLL